MKQAELAAIRNGIIPQAHAVEVAPERTTLTAALDGYKDYVRYHRTCELSAPTVPSSNRSRILVSRTMWTRLSVKIFSTSPPTA